MTTDNQRLAHLETDVAVLKADVAEIKTTVTRLDATMTDIKDLLKTLAPMLIASNARSEEQSKRIDDLSRAVAANTPQRIAAVGSDR
jgi:uncharacterized coiled-coil protein SlyX